MQLNQTLFRGTMEGTVHQVVRSHSEDWRQRVQRGQDQAPPGL